MRPDPDQTLGEIASTVPAATRVFLRHHLDFCCGGGQTLAAACAEAGLDPRVVAIELELEAAQAPSAPDAWAQRPPEELIEHVERRYHATLRRDVPPLIDAARKVERVHRGKPAVPAGLEGALGDMWEELRLHMQKEEDVLFPLLRAGARGARVAMPIRVMRDEHDAHGDRLSRLRELTGDFVPPPHACATWRALYDGLARLEVELMEHIHLENNVLFPKVAS